MIVSNPFSISYYLQKTNDIITLIFECFIVEFCLPGSNLGRRHSLTPFGADRHYSTWSRFSWSDGYYHLEWMAVPIKIIKFLFFIFTFNDFSGPLFSDEVGFFAGFQRYLTLSSLNLPLSSSSTTSRELLSQFSTCSEWRWLKVGWKWKKCIVIIKTVPWTCYF